MTSARTESQDHIPLLRRWPSWSARLAASWSLGYALLALSWLLWDAAFPFGDNDTNATDNLALLTDATPTPTGVVFTGCCLVGTVVALVMKRRVGSGAARVALLTFGWAATVTLLTVLTDMRLIKHLPPLGFFALPRLDWPAVNQLILALGGLLWGMSTLSYQRATRPSCEHCGRDDDSVANPQRVRVWGRWATLLAVLAPLFYAATRLAWALGMPFGVPEGFGTDVSGMEFLLAGLATGGAILTIGLIRPWGERFPRWMIGLRGKPVPLWFPVSFAAVVSVSVIAIGSSSWRSFGLTGQIYDSNGYVGSLATHWGAFLPGLTALVWGVALATATIAYYYRCRARCRHCERG